MVHKIPGTPYASGTITLPPSGSLVSLGSQPLTQDALAAIPSAHLKPSLTHNPTAHHKACSANGSAPDHASNASVNHENGELSFREKLDMLSDNRTTNLYMEG